MTPKRKSKNTDLDRVPGCSWPSCWSRAGSLHRGNTQIHQIGAPSQSNGTKKTNNIQEAEGGVIGGREKRGAHPWPPCSSPSCARGPSWTSGRCHRPWWMDPATIDGQLRAPRPAAGPRRSALGLWFTGRNEGMADQISPVDPWATRSRPTAVFNSRPCPSPSVPCRERALEEI